MESPYVDCYEFEFEFEWRGESRFTRRLGVGILRGSMLFRQRTTEPEYFDHPSRTRDELHAAYKQLTRVNKLFRLEDPYTRLMAPWLGREQCSRLTILDVGAGDGWLGRKLTEWAATQGWDWRVTSLDLNLDALELAHHGPKVAGSALNLPFDTGSFDVVIASQMTHHFNSDTEVIEHFREASRVARSAVFLTDMRRNLFLYAVLWCVLPLMRISGMMRADGLLSVKKSWRVREWHELARRAGLSHAEVRGYYGVRVILAARKPCAQAATRSDRVHLHSASELLAGPAGS